jgi:hypothetical protein
VFVADGFVVSVPFEKLWAALLDAIKSKDSGRIAMLCDNLRVAVTGGCEIPDLQVLTNALRHVVPAE